MRAYLNVVAIGAVLAGISVVLGARAAGPSSASDQGIWKAAIPPKSMHGEFGNLDPVGLAAGARIWADCSLNWTNPDDGKLYCFSSATSLVFFLDWPHANLERARKGFQKLNAGSSSQQK